MKSTKQFVEKSNIPAKLIRSVIRQIGGWQEFKDTAIDICTWGAAGGFGGFTYYVDTVSFAKRNKADIETMLKDFADSVGEPFVDCLTGFNCLKGEDTCDILDGYYNPRSDNQQMVYNALAWYALEEVCRAYCEACEE